MGKRNGKEALIKFSNKSHLPLIQQGLNDRSVLVRSSLCEALGRINTGKSKKLIMKYIRDRAGSVRASAIESAEKLKLKESQPAIRDRLNDPDPFVRGFAVSALYGIGGEAALGSFKERLNKERAWFPKMQLIIYLYRMTKENNYIKKIIKHLNSKYDDVRDDAVAMLRENVNITNVEIITRHWLII